MCPRPRPILTAALSLAFTYLFFFEYLPPFQRVHIPYDLHEYHYPLAGYALQSLLQGRFPQWDPSIYCGISLVGNMQAALFYPPMWLVFAASLGREALSYTALQIFLLAHVWLAFFLCYLWLCRRDLHPVACLLGAATYAYSGYLCEQLQHLGLVAGYSWMPLGLWGIDEAIKQERWRPLWKTVAASALCLLAGYVPTWCVFAVCLVAYSLRRWKTALATVAALAVSLFLASVQLLPAWEAYSLKVPEEKYGYGIREASYLLSALLPNYHNLALGSVGAREDQYLYLGAAALLGLLLLARGVPWRHLAGPLLVTAVCLVFVTNPFQLVWSAISRTTLLPQVLRAWYFLAGIALAVPLLAALGLDRALRQPRRPASPWLPWLTLALLIAWPAWLLRAWACGALATGWSSAVYTVIGVALCALAIYVLPGLAGSRGVVLSVVFLLAIGAEYKAFGTSKRVNAAHGAVHIDYASGAFYAMDQEAFDNLRAHPQYRIAVDEGGPFPQVLRHYMLSTPQGFDPLLTRPYQGLAETLGRFRTDREFDLDPRRLEALHLLGVRYFITSAQSPAFSVLKSHSGWREVGPSRSYYKVFELFSSRPPYGWIPGRESDWTRPVSLTPEVRVFDVGSAAGGRFSLSEQYFPGWQATVDGVRVPIERWQSAFLCLQVPPGRHRVEFRYRSPGLFPGAMISLATASLLVLAAAARPRHWLASHAADGFQLIRRRQRESGRGGNPDV